MQQELSKTRIELSKPQSALTKPPTVTTAPFSLPQGFTHATVYDHHRYILSGDSPLNVTAHQDRCQQLGGYLAEFVTCDELKHVTGFLRDLHLGDAGVILGLTDEGHEGHWTYMTTGRQAWLLDWPEAYGGGGGPGADCVFLRTSNMKLYNWLCVDGDVHVKFLCEVDLLEELYRTWRRNHGWCLFKELDFHYCVCHNWLYLLTSSDPQTFLCFTLNSWFIHLKLFHWFFLTMMHSNLYIKVTAILIFRLQI